MGKMARLVQLHLVGVLVLSSLIGCNNNNSQTKSQPSSLSSANTKAKNSQKDFPQYSYDELLKHISENIPEGAEIQSPNNLKDKKLITIDLDGDNVDEVVACYKNERKIRNMGLLF